MAETKHRKLSTLFVGFIMLFLISCQTYYEPISLAHEPFFSFKERPIRKPELLFLGDYDVWVSLHKNDDDGIYYAWLHIGNGKRNQQILNLQVILSDLKSTEGTYELKDIDLVQAKYREINPPQKRSKLSLTSPINIDLDSDDGYELTYTFNPKPGKKFPQKVCVKIQANYEDNGKVKLFKDSVVFQKETGFTFN